MFWVDTFQKYNLGLNWLSDLLASYWSVSAQTCFLLVEPLLALPSRCLVMKLWEPDSDSTPPALRQIWNCLKALIWYLKLISYQSCQHCFLASFAVWIQFSSKLSKIRFCSDMLKWFALKVLNIQFRSDLMKWFALKSPNINFGRIFQICPRWHFQYSS